LQAVFRLELFRAVKVDRKENLCYFLNVDATNEEIEMPEEIRHNKRRKILHKGRVFVVNPEGEATEASMIDVTDPRIVIRHRGKPVEPLQRHPPSDQDAFSQE